MTRDEAKQLLPIITAFANGEDVQAYYGAEGWQSKEDHGFSWQPDRYRIAPKPRTVWVNEYPHGKFSTWPTKKDADFHAFADRVACHEIELPPLP